MNKNTHIAFTICSNNYLGQALALKKSFLKHNPSMNFYVILVDKFSKLVDYTSFEPGKVIPLTEIEGIDVDDLIARYYIIELNTSIKPSVFKYLKKKHLEVAVIYYLDPDLFFYDSLVETTTILETKSAVLTPHILSPIERDGLLPDENVFLRFGIYNLGFIGINMKSEEALNMLDWWEERNLKFGYDRPNKGYFVDQLWMNHAPLFYKDIEILNTPRYNMAPWNLHERQIISLKGDEVTLNDSSKLVFYHYSKLSDVPEDISREYSRYNFSDFPLLKQLYDDYKEVLSNSFFLEYRRIPIAYNVRAIEGNVANKTSVMHKILKRISWRINALAMKV